MATADDFKYVVTPEEKPQTTPWNGARAARSGDMLVQQDAATTPEETSERIKASGKMTGVGMKNSFTDAANKSMAQGMENFRNSGGATIADADANELPPVVAPTASTSAVDYDTILSDLKKRHEANRKDLKRERRDHLIYSIGDGISALAGLFSAANSGAPTVYNPKSSMSAKAQERYDRIYKQRNEVEDDYLNSLLKVTQAKRAEEAAQTDRWYKQMRLQQYGEQTKANVAYKVAQAERLAKQGDVDGARAALYAAQTSVAEVRAAGYEIDNKTKEDLAKAIENLKYAQAEAARASAAASRARAAGTTETVVEEGVDDFGNPQTKRKTTTRKPANGNTTTVQKVPLPVVAPNGKQKLP